MFHEQYKKIKKIGKGSYGSVYLVQNQTGEQFALKKIKKEDSQNYWGEINCLMDLDTPNVMKIFGDDENEKYIFILCEYFNGGDLLTYQRHQKNSVFSIDQATTILKDVLMGLQEVHKIGYIHRDLKLQNILMRQEENKKIFALADFGFAKKEEKIKNTTLGTSYYMSPQLFDDEPYGFQVDIWAFGVILYFMLNGDYPFKINPHLYIKEQGNALKQLARNFSYTGSISNTKRKIQSNCCFKVQDLFCKIFEPDPQKRITFWQIREHPVFAKHFPDGAQFTKCFYVGSSLKYDEKSTISSFISRKSQNQKRDEHLRNQINKLKFLIFIEKKLDKENLKIKDSYILSLKYNILRYGVILCNIIEEEIQKKNIKTMNIVYEIPKIKESIISTKQQLYEEFTAAILKQIKKENQYFEEYFQERTLDLIFLQKFKRSLRQSTNLAYLKQKEQDKNPFYLLLITLCHFFNWIWEQQPSLVFQVFHPYYIKNKSKAKFPDYESIQQWLEHDAQPAELKWIIKTITIEYFQN